jgi:lambda family phage portal protein
MLDFLKPKPDKMAVACFGALPPRVTRGLTTEPTAAIASSGSPFSAPLQQKVWDGEKFPGGYGATNLLAEDYWTLRARSVELFETNLYARGLIRRLITNEINTGLHLECEPSEKVLGKEEDDLADWAEDVENRFELWGNSAELCDHSELLTFWGLQRAARMEALISGDVLVVMRQDARTGLPRMQLLSGACVQTPFDVKPQGKNKIKHGVELDTLGRQVAYWTYQEDADGNRTPKRIPAVGEKSGRRLAWLVYGTEHRLDDVRGKPLLALILQALKELDRYKDAVLRKAVINSILAMFISKEVAAPGTRPMAAGAVLAEGYTDTSNGGSPRVYNFAGHTPGLVLDELQVGEKPHAFQSNIASERFGEFEKAVLSTIAWANEIPPESFVLSFDSNYSASQAATNEFKMYLNKVRTEFGFAFCQPIYVEWLLSQLLSDRIEADGLIDAWGDWKKYDIFGAWTQADWSGAIKPAIDQAKLVRAAAEAIDAGLTTRARMAREIFGMKASRVLQRLVRENAALALARKPLLEQERPAPREPVESVEETDAKDDAHKAARDAKKAKSN